MNQLGYYGKTPHRGDFVRFNLPQSFISVLDDWLQTLLMSAEQRIEDWADQYALAPQYRFVLSSGIAGNEAWIGLLRASQDKVGRRFPFCLAMSLPKNLPPYLAACSQQLWYSEAETLLSRVFSDEYQFDNLQGELTSLHQAHSTALNITAEAQSTLTKDIDKPVDTLTIAIEHANTASDTIATATLLDAVLAQTLGEYSLWSTGENNSQLTQLTAGLPSLDAGIALFTGDASTIATAYISEKNLADLTAVSSLAPNPTDSRIIATTESTEGPSSSTKPINQSLSTTHSSHTEPVAIDQPSEEDWAALDDFTDTVDNETPLVIPEVEPLELEDDVPEAPWER